MTEQDRDRERPEDAEATEPQGAEVGLGEPNTFEPEEEPDAAVDTEPS